MSDCAKTHPDILTISIFNIVNTQQHADLLQFYNKLQRLEVVSMDGSTFLASLASSSGGAAAAKSPADVKASALVQFNSGILDSLPVQPGVKNITLIPSPSGKRRKSVHFLLSQSPNLKTLQGDRSEW